MTKRVRIQIGDFMNKIIERQNENDRKTNENLKRIKEYSEKIQKTHNEMEAMKDELKIKINNFLLILQKVEDAEASAGKLQK